MSLRRCCPAGVVAPILMLLALAEPGPAAAAPPTVAGCPVFPPDNIWNVRIDDMPVDPRSSDYIAAIGAGEPLHADFGAGLWEGAPMGIPYAVVPFVQPRVEVRFAPFAGEDAIPEESDGGSYPLPADAPIEGGPQSEGDRHVIIVQEGSCTLFELYKAMPAAGGSWSAVAAARFDLEGHELRIEGHTSADAAGLPIFPGLVRPDEVAAGEIGHALRFTAPRTRAGYIWPARHFASSHPDPGLPPMGQRFRLKANVDLSGFSPQARIILVALQRYGMILADNGSPWFLSGVPDDGWDNDRLHDELGRITGADFEAVDISDLMLDPNSGMAR